MGIRITAAGSYYKKCGIMSRTICICVFNTRLVCTRIEKPINHRFELLRSQFSVEEYFMYTYGLQTLFVFNMYSVKLKLPKINIVLYILQNIYTTPNYGLFIIIKQICRLLVIHVFYKYNLNYLLKTIQPNVMNIYTQLNYIVLTTD